MKRTFTLLTVFCAVLLAGGIDVGAQTNPGGGKKNFGYSQNPKTKTPSETRSVVAEKTEPASIQTPAVEVAKATVAPEATRPETSIAEKTLGVVKQAANRSKAPTENYIVGSGDVLFVSLQNNSKASTYFTVLNDGTIDYPLAGEMVSVVGMTTDEIEEILATKIKLYENPLVSVRVREYNSHRVTVLGLVENGGERSIQREAVPLFVIRADASVQPKADTVSVKRTAGASEKYLLKDAQWENVLVFPGDIVEFSASAEAEKANQFVFISGEISNSGKLAFHSGLTLTQAIIVAGGIKRTGIKKAVIRRKNAAGLLETKEYNLKAINEGKMPDPNLADGDIIEIGS
ncbi:MAG: polysaccharide biosynthesis/export family protein [Acidobacteria bacterium]|nr:polysaccharide biosynthesis/export family protein [Acidobacteriota bacterium]